MSILLYFLKYFGNISNPKPYCIALNDFFVSLSNWKRLDHLYLGLRLGFYVLLASVKSYDSA